eukprot:1310900-Prymnesium_polylepis.1
MGGSGSVSRKPPGGARLTAIRCSVASAGVVAPRWNWLADGRDDVDEPAEPRRGGKPGPHGACGTGSRRMPRGVGGGVGSCAPYASANDSWRAAREEESSRSDDGRGLGVEGEGRG